MEQDGTPLQRGDIVVYEKECYYYQPNGTACYLYTHPWDIGNVQLAAKTPSIKKVRKATRIEALAYRPVTDAKRKPLGTPSLSSPELAVAEDTIRDMMAKYDTPPAAADEDVIFEPLTENEMRLSALVGAAQQLIAELTAENKEYRRQIMFLRARLNIVTINVKE
jgi:hypothetical protein